MWESWTYWLPHFAVLTHALIVIAILVRVIMNRPAPGVALAWSLLVSAIPLAGLIL